MSNNIPLSMNPIMKNTIQNFRHKKEKTWQTLKNNSDCITMGIFFFQLLIFCNLIKYPLNLKWFP